MKEGSSRCRRFNARTAAECTKRRGGVESNPNPSFDFSANINPLGPPQGVLSAIANALRRLAFGSIPDAHAFVSVIADKHRLMPDEIVAGSGAASLIFAVMHALSSKKSALT